MRAPTGEKFTRRQREILEALYDGAVIWTPLACAVTDGRVKSSFIQTDSQKYEGRPIHLSTIEVLLASGYLGIRTMDVDGMLRIGLNIYGRKFIEDERAFEGKGKR